MATLVFSSADFAMLFTVNPDLLPYCFSVFFLLEISVKFGAMRNKAKLHITDKNGHLDTKTLRP